MTAARHSFRRDLARTTVVALGLLLAGEVTLRLWAYFFRHPYQRIDPRLGMIALVPGYEANFNGKVLRINSRGIRGAEFAEQKAPGVFRIIMLGDSITFGLAGDDCTYPGVVQQRFEEELPGRVEVINAGVEGYDSQDARRLLERRLMSYSPDLVTVMIGWNDLSKRDPADPGGSVMKARLAYSLYDVYLVKFWRSFVYKRVRGALLRPGTDLAPEEEAALQAYVPLVYKENLERIVLTAKQGGSQVVLFTFGSLLRPDMGAPDVRKLYFPYYTYNLKKFMLLIQRYNETIRAVGREQGVPVFEPGRVLEGRESELYMDAVHPTCEGEQMVGNYLHTALSPLAIKRIADRDSNGRPRP